MTTMGAAMEAARLGYLHSPFLRCKSRPGVAAATPIGQDGVRFPRIRSAAVSHRLIGTTRSLRSSDVAAFHHTCGAPFGLPAGLCSREPPSSGFYPGPKHAFPGSRLSIVAQAKKDTVQAPDRVVAALGYVLPLFDGIQYGRYFFLQYPAAEVALRPLYPLLSAYKSFPYSNFIAFFALYLLVVRNERISRYVRFNAMQAVVLDVLLILPTLVERTFAPRGGVGFELLIIFYNTVFLFLVVCFIFGVVSCVLGRTPRLPIVADAADAQV